MVAAYHLAYLLYLFFDFSPIDYPLQARNPVSLPSLWFETNVYQLLQILFFDVYYSIQEDLLCFIIFLMFWFGLSNLEQLLCVQPDRKVLNMIQQVTRVMCSKSL